MDKLNRHSAAHASQEKGVIAYKAARVVRYGDGIPLPLHPLNDASHRKRRRIYLRPHGQDELIRRLSSRGRDDDNEEVWHKKIEYFEEAGKPFFAELKKQGLNVVDVDGTGSKEEVAERLYELSKKVVQK